MTIGSAVPRTTTPAPSSALNLGPVADAPEVPDEPNFKGIRKNGRNHHAHNNAGGAAWSAARSGVAGVQARTTTSTEPGGGTGESILPGGIRRNGRIAHRFLGELHPVQAGVALVGDLTSGGSGDATDDFPPFGIRRNGRHAIKFPVPTTPPPFSFPNASNASNARAHQYSATDSIADAVAEAGNQDGMRRNGLDADAAV